MQTLRDAWVAQSAKQPTPDFGSGRDLMGRESEPLSGLHTWGGGALLEILSFSPSPHLHMLALSNK